MRSCIHGVRTKRSAASRSRAILTPIRNRNGVEALKASIIKDGFWSGVVARRTKHNGIELIAGAQRVKAAMDADKETADIYVGDFSEEDVIRIYGNENSLQRGNAGTALTGSVAAAVRLGAELVLRGEAPQLRGISLGHALGAGAAVADVYLIPDTLPLYDHPVAFRLNTITGDQNGQSIMGVIGRPNVCVLK